MNLLGLKFMLLLITNISFHCSCQKLVSLDKVFQRGVKAYADERWTKCIDEFEESMHLYKLYKSIIINCRLKCNSETQESQIKENIDDVKIYEHFFNKKDCVNRCQEVGFQHVHINITLEEDTMYNLQNLKPYEYLHLCYYQMRMYDKAASSAYTYLLANPNDDRMKSNLKYYMEQPEVDATAIEDYESDDYTILYTLGRKSYEKNNWAETVASMEQAIKEYLASENKCRVECERQPSQEWSSEFVITISNNIASLLHCRQQCQDKLKFLEYDTGIEFFADILNYLQISYYHLEKYDNAAQAVASYLLLMPRDEDMLANEEFYKTYVDKSEFTHRSDIVYYLKRDTYEKSLLNFFHQEKNISTDNNSI